MRSHIDLVLRVLTPVKNWAEQSLTAESRSRTVFWLKAIYISIFLIAVLSLASVYYFVTPRAKSVTVKKLASYSISLIGIVAFTVAIFTSLMIPYAAWTCEASRNTFNNPGGLRRTQLIIQAK